ncbi:O-antigen ligase family protein [Pseudoxanthomonas koreensis]|uniref:O-antigen ligase family protein n=1 Tax=Pseudoxanthomonas koreensis TaxID=266061 RepID=UPI0035A5910B
MELSQRAGSRLSFLATALLVLAFVTGGGSADRGLGDAATQLLACVVLPWALHVLLHDPERPPALRWILLLVALVPAGIALQLIGGITRTPWATERALWSILPALAAFTAALALPRARQARLAWTIVWLAVASLLLGYLQLGAPQDSILNPFPDLAPMLNGVFANQNHQATAIGIALVLLAAWAFDPRRQDADGQARHSRMGGLIAAAGAAALLLVALPIVGSRAMALISLGALLLVPLCTGWLRQRLVRGRRRQGTFMLLAGVVAGALVLAAVSGWLKVDYASESRIAMARATAALAADAMPWGTGVGSFVQWFDANTPDTALQWAYVNHAHNEYVQWWLESGVGGLAWIALLVAGMAWSLPRCAWRADAGPDWLAAGSWLAVAIVLAHSAADYPLRTPAIMTITAFLAGIAVRAAAARGGFAKSSRYPHTAVQGPGDGARFDSHEG